MFTRVLKGHIALDTQPFPPGTPGCLLDTLARQHLWAAGRNYLHGKCIIRLPAVPLCLG
jgi:Xaa-Pro aminopeptidase